MTLPTSSPPSASATTSTAPVATITLDRPEVRNAQTPAMWRALAEIGARAPRRRAGRGRHAARGSRSRPGWTGRCSTRRRTAGDRGRAARAERRGDRRRPSTTTSRASPSCATRASSRSRRCGATRSAPASSSPCPATCGWWPTTPSSRMKESALGLVPDLTGTKPLVESVGYARALEICATARMVGADEAVDIGLADCAVPAAELDADRRRPRRRPHRTDGGCGHRDQGAAARGG